MREDISGCVSGGVSGCVTTSLWSTVDRCTRAQSNDPTDKKHTKLLQSMRHGFGVWYHIAVPMNHQRLRRNTGKHTWSSRQWQLQLNHCRNKSRLWEGEGTSIVFQAGPS